MTRAVNVKIKPDEELYETVVLPNQKIRKLAPLILTLLTGYRDDPYIRRYADGELAGLDDDVQSELLRQVKEAQDELNALNYINENLNTASKAGVGYFAERFYEARSGAQGAAPSEDDSLTTRVSRLEELFSALMERLDNPSAAPVANVTQDHADSSFIFSPPVESDFDPSSLNLSSEVFPDDSEVIEAEVIEDVEDDSPTVIPIEEDSWDLSVQDEGIAEGTPSAPEPTPSSPTGTLPSTTDTLPDTSLANALIDSIGGL